MEQRNLETGRTRQIRPRPWAGADAGRLRWEDELSEASSMQDSPCKGPRCTPKVFGATAAAVVTGAAGCVVAGEALLGEGELYAGLADGVDSALDWTADGAKAVADFLGDIL
mmetsp:Transcript_113680/g.355495  ORF Transcript_113680/g.355495 Transcript_113680/m.355495 type:complete len:112 (-) Transcript_113680:13-348(-)